MIDMGMRVGIRRVILENGADKDLVEA